jgi:hypothetical protein
MTVWAIVNGLQKLYLQGNSELEPWMYIPPTFGVFANSGGPMALVCGAVAGPDLLINLITNESAGGPIRCELYDWYAHTALPTTDWDHMFDFKNTTQSVSKSASCHISRSHWEYMYLSERFSLPATGTPGESSFVDVRSDSPYCIAIESMSVAGIIDGYEVPGGREFRPDSPIWRAQVAKMIVGAMGLPVSESDSWEPFTDLGPNDPSSLYPHEFVGAAYRAGITTGKSATSFAPWDDISRAQVVSMVVRAAHSLRPGVLHAPPSGWRGSIGIFDSTHGENLVGAEYNGLLNGLEGYGSRWNPWLKMSRGEVAQVLWNLLQKAREPSEPAGPYDTTRCDKIHGDCTKKTVEMLNTWKASGGKPADWAPKANFAACYGCHSAGLGPVSDPKLGFVKNGKEDCTVCHDVPSGHPGPTSASR